MPKFYGNSENELTESSHYDLGAQLNLDIYYYMNVQAQIIDNMPYMYTKHRYDFDTNQNVLHMIRNTIRELYDD